MTKAQLLKRYPAMMREDGVRMEILCPHGVGHPVRMLSGAGWQDWMDTHGCDGCCGSKNFQRAEAYHLMAREIAAEKALKAHGGKQRGYGYLP